MLLSNEKSKLTELNETELTACTLSKCLFLVLGNQIHSAVEAEVSLNEK